MEAPEDNQSDRIDLRNDSLTASKNEGQWQSKSEPGNDVQLAEAAAKRWRRLDGHQHIISLLQGKKFVNGIQQAAA